MAETIFGELWGLSADAWIAVFSAPSCLRLSSCPSASTFVADVVLLNPPWNHARRELFTLHQHSRTVTAFMADVQGQFLSQPFPSQPLFIYIPLSLLSLWVIKPGKSERRMDLVGGARTLPQWWKWVLPSLLLTYLIHTIAALNTLEVPSSS